MTEIIRNILFVIDVFFILYLLGYSTFLFLSVAVGSSELYREQRLRNMKNELSEQYHIPVSIVVPAYNEEVTVVATVRSLLSLDYNTYEIIVVDDGSKDNTSGELISALNMQKIRMPIRRQVFSQKAEAVYITTKEKVPVTLVRKKNGGKADALNMGINVSKFPYFLCIDADSVLQYNSLKNIVQPALEDERIVAVGGTVRACNSVEFENSRVKNYRLPSNLLAAMQVLEYDRSFLASRILFDVFNGSMIISGAFGLFRKDVVIAAGGYDVTTMGEDMELVVRLHEYCISNNIPYVIKYAPDAICWTQVPESLKDLCKQRKRWHIGLFQSMLKHSKIMKSSKFGKLGYISYLYFLLYELLSPYIELLGIFVTVLSYLFELINVPFMILFFLIYAVYGSILSITAFLARLYATDLKTSVGDVFKAMGLCLFEITALRFVLASVRMRALIGYKNKKHEWGRIERKKIDLK